MDSMNTLLSIGHGYSAAALAQRLLARGWRVIGTTRSREAALRAEGVEVVRWGEDLPLSSVTHVLSSVAPGAEGDPVLLRYGAELRQMRPVWAGYLSTTAVYGDHQGGWVDEATPVTPSTRRGQMRAEAERAWIAQGGPLHIFRLAGIYGPGRGPFEKVRDGTAECIIKKDQIFSRIHVEDIATVLEASIDRPHPGAIYNVCDDEPCPPEDVLRHAARLLGLPPPPDVPYETADMGPLARSFYAESKRVSNRRIREELGVKLAYPSYREGLAALLAEEEIPGG